MINQKKKSGLIMTVIIVSSAVAVLTTLAVLATRFIRKKKEQQDECGDVFDYTFDGNNDDDFENETSESTVFGAGTSQDGNPFEGE